jgi:hypothetical protein
VISDAARTAFSRWWPMRCQRCRERSMGKRTLRPEETVRRDLVRVGEGVLRCRGKLFQETKRCPLFHPLQASRP